MDFAWGLSGNIWANGMAWYKEELDLSMALEARGY